MNLDASKVISRNFRSLRDDSTTRNILNKLPLKAYGRSKNLRDLLVRSSLPRNLPNQPTGAFPCLLLMSPCQFIYHKGRPRDILASRDLFFLHHGQRGLLFDLHQISIDKSTLERLDSSWRTVSENTAEMSSTGEMTFLYMITSTRPITHWST